MKIWTSCFAICARLSRRNSPRHVLGGPGYQAPSDTLNFAVVGMGSQGSENAESLGTENLVAVCDVDLRLRDRRAITFAPPRIVTCASIRGKRVRYL